jgi:hypothetical protein
VSPRRDAVPVDARAASCRPNRFIAFEHATKIGTRESFGPGMTLAAAALTTDGSESLATDTSGNPASFFAAQTSQLAAPAMAIRYVDRACDSICNRLRCFMCEPPCQAGRS